MAGMKKCPHCKIEMTEIQEFPVGCPSLFWCMDCGTITILADVPISFIPRYVTISGSFVRDKVFTLHSDGSFDAINMTNAEIELAKKQALNKGAVFVSTWQINR